MEQAEVVWDGIYIAGREDEEHNILLYQIGDLYVEVYHHKEYNVIRKFNAFSTLEVPMISEPAMSCLGCITVVKQPKSR
jgi:hypothetical protein